MQESGSWREQSINLIVDELIQGVSHTLIHYEFLSYKLPFTEHGENIPLSLAIRGLLSASDIPLDLPILNVETTDSTIKRVLSNNGERHLRTSRFIEFADIAVNKVCPILQDEFHNNDMVTLLPCNHCFTPDAITRWLTRECAECPVCRFALPSIEIDSKLINHSC